MYGMFTELSKQRWVKPELTCNYVDLSFKVTYKFRSFLMKESNWYVQPALLCVGWDFTSQV